MLGSVLVGGTEAMTQIATFLRAEDFYFPAHGLVYSAAQELYGKSVPIDIVTLSSALEQMGEIAKVGGRSKLAHLETAQPTSANVEHYARIVKSLSRKRAGLRIAQNLVAEGFDPEVESDDFIQRAQARYFSLALSDSRQGFERLGDGQLTGLIERVAALDEGGISSRSTGFPGIDRVLGGLRDSELCIIAGKTSMGKTSFALNIAVSGLHQDPDFAVAIFSLEMAKQNLTERLVAQVAGIDSTKLRDGGLTPDEWGKVNRAIDLMEPWNLFIDADPTLDSMSMLAKVRQLHQRERAGNRRGISLVIVDYLQLMSGSGAAKDANRTQEVGHIAKACRAVAREFEIPVLAVSQLSRANDHREDKRPILSDLRDSGELEQVADSVLFVHRPEVYKAEDKPGIAEILIRKNRNGPTGTIDLRFHKSLTQFTDDLAPAWRRPEVVR